MIRYRPRPGVLAALLTLTILAPPPAEAFLGRLLGRGATRAAGRAASSVARRTTVRGMATRVRGAPVVGARTASRAAARAAGDGAELTLKRGNFLVRDANGQIRTVVVERTPGKSVGAALREAVPADSKVIRMTRGEFENAAGGTVSILRGPGQNARWVTSANGIPAAQVDDAVASATRLGANTGFWRDVAIGTGLALGPAAAIVGLSQILGGDQALPIAPPDPLVIDPKPLANRPGNTRVDDRALATSPYGILAPDRAAATYAPPNLKKK